MPQANLIISDKDAGNVFANINSANQALASDSSGPTAPPNPLEGQKWRDTSGTNDVLRLYEGGKWVAAEWGVAGPPGKQGPPGPPGPASTVPGPPGKMGQKGDTGDIDFDDFKDFVVPGEGTSVIIDTDKKLIAYNALPQGGRLLSVGVLSFAADEDDNTVKTFETNIPTSATDIEQNIFKIIVYNDRSRDRLNAQSQDFIVGILGTSNARGVEREFVTPNDNDNRKLRIWRDTYTPDGSTESFYSVKVRRTNRTNVKLFVEGFTVFAPTEAVDPDGNKLVGNILQGPPGPPGPPGSGNEEALHAIEVLQDQLVDLQAGPPSSGWSDSPNVSAGGMDLKEDSPFTFPEAQAATYELDPANPGNKYLVVRLPKGDKREQARVRLLSTAGTTFYIQLSSMHFLGSTTNFDYYGENLAFGSFVDLIKLQLTGEDAHVGTSTYRGNLVQEKVYEQAKKIVKAGTNITVVDDDDEGEITISSTEDSGATNQRLEALEAKTTDLQAGKDSTGWSDATSTSSQGGMYSGAAAFTSVDTSTRPFSRDSDWEVRLTSGIEAHLVVRINKANVVASQVRIRYVSGQGTVFDEALTSFTSIGSDANYNYYAERHVLGDDIASLQVQVTGSAAHIGTSSYGGNLDRDKVIEALGTDYVGTSAIKDGAVTAAKLGDDSVTQSKVADDAVGGAQLKDGAVSEDKIRDGAVSEDKLENNSVSSDKLKNDAVVEGKIADDAVVAGSIKDGTIGVEKLNSALSDRVLPLPGEGRSLKTYLIEVNDDNDGYQFRAPENYLRLLWKVDSLEAKANDLQAGKIIPSRFISVTADSQGGIISVNPESTLAEIKAVNDNLWRFTQTSLGGGAGAVVRIPVAKEVNEYWINATSFRGDTSVVSLTSFSLLGSDSTWKYYIGYRPVFGLISNIKELELWVKQSTDFIGTSTFGGNLRGDKVVSALGKRVLPSPTGLSSDSGKLPALNSAGDGYELVSPSTASVTDGSITTAKLADDAVTGAKLDSGVSERLLAAPTDASSDAKKVMALNAAGDAWELVAQSGSGGSGTVANGSITTAKLANEAVTTAKIDDDAVTGAKLAAGAVDGAALATNAVTNTKIADNSVFGNKIRDNAIVSRKIDTGGVSGSNIASNAISSAKIANGAVTADKIAGNAISSGKVAAGAINVSKLDSALSGRVLAAPTDASSDAKKVMALNAAGDAWELVAQSGSGSGTLADGAVGTAKLADEAVTTAKIDDEGVTTAKLADEAVTTAKIDDEGVTTAKLADDAVTSAKVISGAINSSKLAQPIIERLLPIPPKNSRDAGKVAVLNSSGDAYILAAQSGSGGSTTDEGPLNQRLEALEAKTSDLSAGQDATGWANATTRAQGGIYTNASARTLTQAQALRNNQWRSSLTSGIAQHLVVRIPATGNASQYQVRFVSRANTTFDEGLSSFALLGSDSNWKYYQEAHVLGTDISSLTLRVTGSAAHIGTSSFGGNLVKDKIISTLGDGAIDTDLLKDNAVDVDKLADAIVARLLPSSLGTAGQVLQVNSGATAVEYATPAASGGGGAFTKIGNSFSASVPFNSATVAGTDSNSNYINYNPSYSDQSAITGLGNQEPVIPYFWVTGGFTASSGRKYIAEFNQPSSSTSGALWAPLSWGGNQPRYRFKLRYRVTVGSRIAFWGDETDIFIERSTPSRAYNFGFPRQIPRTQTVNWGTGSATDTITSGDLKVHVVLYKLNT